MGHVRLPKRARRRHRQHRRSRGRYSSTPVEVISARRLLRAGTGNAPLGPVGAAQLLADSESPASTEPLAGGRSGQRLRPRAHHQDARLWRIPRRGSRGGQRPVSTASTGCRSSALPGLR
jgi:hypothetical protein